MKTVGDAMAEGYDQLVIHWREPTRHGTERRPLADVSITTGLESLAAGFATDAGRQTLTGVSVTRPRKDLTAPLDHDELFLWGERAT